jgi:ribosomal protein S13
MVYFCLIKLIDQSFLKINKFINMISLSSLKLSKNKKVVFYLTEVRGIGKKTSIILANDLGFGNDIRFKDINQTKNILVRQWLESENVMLNHKFNKK